MNLGWGHCLGPEEKMEFPSFSLAFTLEAEQDKTQEKLEGDP